MKLAMNELATFMSAAKKEELCM